MNEGQQGSNNYNGLSSGGPERNLKKSGSKIENLKKF
tara:strand:- start:291 stop:401 length:111 start_codon:yes stop_codon:yes gene_type:complete